MKTIKKLLTLLVIGVFSCALLLFDIAMVNEPWHREHKRRLKKEAMDRYYEKWESNSNCKCNCNNNSNSNSNTYDSEIDLETWDNE